MTFSLLFGLLYLLNFFNVPDSSNVPFLDNFSSKTAYRHSNMLPHSVPSNQETCKLVHVNALFRHGTRYPPKDDISNIEVVHKKIMESKSRSNLPESFVNWKPTFEVDQAKQLSNVGYEEMMMLGQRFRDRLQNAEGYLNETEGIAAFATSVKRTRESGIAFLQKFLTGKKTYKEVSDRIKERDYQLRFFDNCPVYTKTVNKNKAAKIESKKFAEGPEIKQIISDIQKQWKLTDVNLTTDDVRTMYIMCGYEIANNVSSHMKPYLCQANEDKDNVVCPRPKWSAPIETSPLCSLLEEHHYSIFEYIYDLKHYWTKSYGHNINWLQSCDLMSSMLEQINAAADGHKKALKASMLSKKPLEFYLRNEKYLRGAFWFGHAETVLPLSSLLGLYNQSSPMIASAYKERLSSINDPEKRFDTFQVSNIAPFSGNIALELHHCSSDTTGSGYYVTVKSNEKTVRWSLAGGKSRMTLESFIDKMDKCSADKYSHTDLCDLGKTM